MVTTLFLRYVLHAGAVRYRNQRRLCSLPLALRSLKGKSLHERPSYFVDWKRIQTVGGNGGDGCIAFLQLFCNPNAGPAGGDGGHGGHVLLRSESDVKSLENVPSTPINGFDGQPGLGKECHGARGEHVFIPVPLGTVVKDRTGKVLADLDAPGLLFLASRGGAGGRGNKYYLSNENRHPFICQRGGKGEVKTYFLEMKSMAHAGLIGFPNAGKSTLLQAISRAKPKVASYPFTTLKPHLGVIDFEDYEQVSVADLPGIIEGAASHNRGLGIEFLRHADRCGCLVYVIDVSQETYTEQLNVLCRELEIYKKGFSKKMSLIVANKIDLVEKIVLDERLQTLGRMLKIPVVPISAKFGTNISAMVKYLRITYEKSKEKAKGI
ncbi:mitochondrial ribosome-associated GTPase 2-like [Varroa jacobsoni]|uniref:Mitochondrial ribosome-associated GTPase 2 n=1 Tax=Varroa destructor TaxID=109461 RepID=A0A7M7KQ05_VARDE|nr:mitochondrial ribosome-associated GTPase 2-like [Varroa destructor]XP_022687188.1 mitochondrial ribosome-associated GTPase 2-like [Varroa jacobsoni]